METLFVLCLSWSASYIFSMMLQKFFPLFSIWQNRTNYKCQYFFKYCIPMVSASLFLAFYRGQLSPVELITLLTGLYLIVYDCQYQAYPFLLWLVSFTGSIFFALPNWMTLTLLLLAGLAQLGYIPMGTGDFLYLASISLFLDFRQLLSNIEIASLTGLLAFTLYRDKKSIPFVPFIYFGLILILSIKKLA